ncbi:recombinase family protein [Paenibacillus sp. 598K]|uniref:recombinase family protein n=1 Tax=Paenibacillus sp. 598K TaxID=1117987 RepID=UPI0021A9BC30|nr:recombinase family protein [Paenibacillus sp. 598K]
MNAVKLAYGRVSAKDQNPERQLVKFRELGVEERFTFVDKQSGKDFDRSRLGRTNHCTIPSAAPPGPPPAAARRALRRR